MSPTASGAGTAFSIAIPVLLLAGILAVLGDQSGLVRIPRITAAAEIGPELVTIASRAYTYRPSGEFLSGRASMDAPLVEVTAPQSLDIMKFEVRAADYARCVADKACERADPRRRGKGDVPVTGVSFDDAAAYASWLSARTGDNWRLPTIAEWTFAAGSKAADVALGLVPDAGDPAARWLASYERESTLGDGALAAPSPLGSFGVNEFGVADLAGPVWEWTASCGGRTTLSPSGDLLSHLDSCGVHYLEGRHRAQMSNFVRDAIGGGCSAGTPPDNLGFRLVRD
ncbi:MAG: SUMF1/EgtB/PvdO family nonheme iron enzyme [Devosia sp.]